MKSGLSFSGKLRTTTLLTSVFFLLSLTDPEPASAAPVQAAAAYDFIDSMGVNIHMGHTQTGNVYSNVALIKSELSYAGFRYARDSILNWGISLVPRLLEVNQATGIKYMIFVCDAEPQEVALIKSNFSLIAEAEGCNEIDNWPPTFNGLTGYPAGVAIQQQLWSDIKNAPNAASLPVDTLTIANYSKDSLVGDLSPYADRSTVHMYMQFGGAGGSFTYSSVAWNIANTAIIKNSTTPRIISETGWWTLPAAAGVTETVQAKFMLDIVLDAFKQGVKRTMFYELADETNEPSGTDKEQHFGLFHYDGSPKLSATAFHNLMTLLKDDQPLSSPGSLSYTVTGLPAATYQLLLQKSDGTFVLALWHEGKFWDNVLHQELTVAPVNANLQLGEAAARVRVFDPLTGTTPGVDMASVTNLSIAVPDHPVLVFITPAAPAPAPAPTPTPTPVPVNPPASTPVPTLPPVKPLISTPVAPPPAISPPVASVPVVSPPAASAPIVSTSDSSTSAPEAPPVSAPVISPPVPETPAASAPVVLPPAPPAGVSTPEPVASVTLPVSAPGAAAANAPVVSTPAATKPSEPVKKKHKKRKKHRKKKPRTEKPVVAPQAAAKYSGWLD